MTPLESLIVNHFRSKGGFFAVDEDGDLQACLGVERRGLYGPVSTISAAFLVFGVDTLPPREAQIITRALVNAAEIAKAAGDVTRIKLSPGDSFEVVRG